MLVEFSVSNFKSFLEEQKLSLVASNYEKEHAEHLIDPQVKGMKKMRLLRGAALYGANASGKSNLFDGFWMLRHLVVSVTRRARPDGDFGTGVSRFKLGDLASGGEGTKFGIKFLLGGKILAYTLEVTEERISNETLATIEGSRSRVLFERRFDVETGRYAWRYPSPGLPADHALEQRIRQEATFLSVASEFNHPVASEIVAWFGKWETPVLNPRVHFPRWTAQLCFDDPSSHSEVTRLLQLADLGVERLNVRTTERTIMLPEYAPPGADSPAARTHKIMDYEVGLVHAGTGGSSYELDWRTEESTGTRALFALAGPWLRAIKNGGLVLIDEIESSLHPILVRELLRLILHPKPGSPPSQIIFTTHNPLLLEGDLLRRDQVWFTEKDREGRSHLYPLSDFKPRKGEALSKGYMVGRYGGIPFIPEGLLP